MSVDFTVEPAENDEITFRVECECGAVSAPMAEAPSQLIAAALTGDETGSGCGAVDYCCGAYLNVEIDRPTLSVSNQHAAEILWTLGYVQRDEYGALANVDEALAGEATAQDFLGRVLIAQAGTPSDPGVPAQRFGRHIDCGRRPGYLDQRLAELRELAEWAARQHRPVIWG